MDPSLVRTQMAPAPATIPEIPLTRRHPSKLSHEMNIPKFLLTRTFAVLSIALSASGGVTLEAKEPARKLWYQQPATDWQSQALPIGNGHIGVMFFGGVEKEQIQFTEATLWAGGPGTGSEYNFGLRDGAWKYLAEVRRLLDEGKMKEAHELANRELTGIQNEGVAKFGDYGAHQAMGDIFVEVKHEGAVTNYTRELDIENAEGRVSYSSGDAEYSRTYFGSYPANTMVYRFESTVPADYAVRFETTHRKNHETFIDFGYVFQGEVADNGMQFETRLKFETDGEVSYSNGEVLVSGANTLTLYHVAATDYINEFPIYKGNNYGADNLASLQHVAGKSYQALRDEHREDYQALFQRVTFDLGGESRDDLPTDVRLRDYANGMADAGLEELFFQYDRYLMIAASRPGGMPLNLQGRWNNSNDPAWACDYHMNINQQMLYWPAEITNLSECHLPLFDYMETLVEPGRNAAQTFFNTRGWIVNTMNNPFGYTSPGWKFPWGFFPGGAAWLCQHVWEHYEFTQDERFLAETGYPLMKEAALFWIDNLIEDENGYLVSTPSYSPEHGGISRGASMDHQIAWDLLNNCIAAAEVLKIDHAFAAEAKAARDRIFPPTIGSWGQLQEWKEDVDDPTSQHRHVSHLFALHPGKQISMETTPDLAEAAKVSLNARGDGGTGWSLAWKVNFWARLKDGDRAHRLLQNLLSPVATRKGQRGGTYDNLLCTHPPFQLDGNMGSCAGMVEMLLQSHAGKIELLPALPSAWPSGQVTGLKARGGYEVNLAWENGKLITADIAALEGGLCQISYDGKIQSKNLQSNEVWSVTF